MKVFRKPLIVSGMLSFGQQVVLLAIPLVVQRLLQWLIEDEEPTYVGVIWAITL